MAAGGVTNNPATMEALKSAPAGIPVYGFMSNAPKTTTLSNDIYTDNNAQVVNSSGVNSNDGNIVALANGPKTYGSMWSTNQSFDIHKKQSISAWLYFGSGDENTDALNSEGIAFVLQNDQDDNNGLGALGAGLEGLGVYGYDASQFTKFGNLVPLLNYYTADRGYIKNSAIQNSIALEFDTSMNSFFKKDTDPNTPINNDTGLFSSTSSKSNYFSLDGYDTSTGIKGPDSLGDTPTYGTYGGAYGHIALAYPAEESSYYPMTANSKFGWKTGYALVHQKSQSASLINAEDQNHNTVYWHHLTIHWTPPTNGTTGTLTYSMNDKNMDYSDNTATDGDYAKVGDSIKVDIGKLNSDNGKVRWGFTAANGIASDVASKLVAFDSIPDELYAEADANIVDTNLNDKKITDDSTDNNVRTGDLLKLNYDLSYVSGTKDWENILAKIKIPTNVTLLHDSEDNVGTITYNDNSTEKISSSEFSDGTITHKIQNSLNSTSKIAHITINAIATNTTTSNIDVTKAAAVFSSPNNIASTSTPDFTILPKPDYTLDLANSGTSDKIALPYKQTPAELILPTTLNYSDNRQLNDDTISYKITVAEKTYNVIVNTTGRSHKENIDLKNLIDDGTTDETKLWNTFAKNTQTPVEVQATDLTTSITSNPITYTVTTQNNLVSLIVSKDLNFKDINYGDSTEILPRKGNFKLSVNSDTDPWKLEVSTGGLSLNGQPVNNNMALIYKKPPVTPTSSQYNSSVDSAISSSPALIAEDTAKDKQSSWENSDWTDNSGILLKQIGISKAGSYSGKLSWTLTDTLQNNSQ